MARTKRTARKTKSDKGKRKGMATKSAQKQRPELPAGGKRADSNPTEPGATGGESEVVNPTTGEERSDQLPPSDEAADPTRPDQPPSENGPESRPEGEPTQMETQEEQKTATSAETAEESATKEE